MIAPRPSRRLVLAELAAALLLAGCEEKKALTRRGDAAPELVALDLDGELVRLEALRGKIVLINFWLAGCGPCLSEMPKLDAFYKVHRAEGFVLLGLNMGQSQATVRQISRRLELSFPLLLDPLSITTDRYSVTAAPTSFIIDAEGKLVERLYGPLSEETLAAKIGHNL